MEEEYMEGENQVIQKAEKEFADSIESPPQYLYHYTTVESLAMILRNRTIKFSPLTMLDDVQEEKVKDNKRYARFVFVSSWTEDENESIPMWNMYARMEHGVRIKMSSSPFKTYGMLGGYHSLTVADTLFTRKYIMMPNVKEGLAKKIVYTDDNDLLVPQVRRHENGKVYLDFSKMGKYKNISWEFQKEWRYVLWFAPIGPSELLALQNIGMNIAISRIDDDAFQLPFTSYFLEIDDDSYSKMEVTLNPKISDGNRILVSLLQKEYNHTLRITDSLLINSIR